LSCASFFLTLAGSRLSGKREQQAPAANRTPVVSQAIPRAADFSPDNRGFDIILLMDSSGSMKRTDPHIPEKTLPDCSSRSSAEMIAPGS
jgi:hypothetical protein